MMGPMADTLSGVNEGTICVPREGSDEGEVARQSQEVSSRFPPPLRARNAPKAHLGEE